LLVVSCLVWSNTGCASRHVNARIDCCASDSGYCYYARQRPHNNKEVLFVVAFSGGGTRAASLSYGVLEELARTEIGPPDHRRRMLDEVDVISSVSGGSVTAAAYAYYGDAVFHEYESRFLKRNVQGALIGDLLNPLNWPRLGSPNFGRSDLAAEYYDRILFNGATFGDLCTKTGPFVVINATDVTTGARFEFTKDNFELICSDLDRYPISRAVAASSAVPVVLSPITLNNYAGGCNYQLPHWLELAQAQDGVCDRLLFHAQEVLSYQNRHGRPYIHLVDGGVSDNLGLRAALDVMMALELDDDHARLFELDRVRKIVFVVVNARAMPDRGWDQKESPPNFIELAAASSAIPISRYSYETIELMKDMVARWCHAFGEEESEKLAPGHDASHPRITFYPIVVRFEDIADLEERSYFLNQPTSFALPDEAVDRLRGVAGQLLRESAMYQKLMHDLGEGAVVERPSNPDFASAEH